ncbi:Cof-type HAD-IIB family hydrolase [Paenibacillus radicis (ex Xue et al. 2023)]|uniref:Cof-type HAD-IIB family hydrolase n=1 Tax=Paenibacillus radicis (ex Xue et al. 2023) TaxID=2972489 RepID=A0ABT1YK47_9BACL|nr:Cof-type HAD-IIB family hydrolase [Paenibacillus radicis (ex Xue et al. 2023)]MCR8633546.1 Cof-type HAD-IIB family hydrolase [Paenibacillus radicis (ex Xue et al. 2023)]
MNSKRFQGTMLVTDMDGTLLSSGKTISKENLNAIERFVEQGGLFTLATGRIASSAKRFADQLPIGAPAILYNGAVIHDFIKGENVWHRTLGDSVRPVLERLMKQFPQLAVEIYCGEEPYFIRENRITEHHRKMEGFTRPLQQDGFNEIKEPWYKVLLAWEPELLDEVEAYAESEQVADITWVRSDDKYFEILPANATKGHALEHLMELTGIERTNCIAMGDHLNDLEMLRRAGVGIAVANAHQSLLNVSNRTCKHHDEHAVADVIEWLESRI